MAGWGFTFGPSEYREKFTDWIETLCNRQKELFGGLSHGATRKIRFYEFYYQLQSLLQFIK